MNQIKINGIYRHFKGDYYLLVDVAKPDWVMSQNKEKDWIFKNPVAEVWIDGKFAAELPVRLLSEDEYTYCYEAVAGGEEALKLHEGETIEFVFRLEDSNGLKYRYVAEKGTYMKEGEYLSEAPVDSAEAIVNGKLTIE